MAQKKRRFRIIIIFILFFIFYFFTAARPIEREIVLAPKWISSLADDAPLSVPDSPYIKLFPFTLGRRFGYVDSSGQLAVNRIRTNNIYLSRNMWTEFDAQPVNIEIKNIFEETVKNIENPGGYPILLDNRVFIIGSDQNSLSEIGENGEILWSYELGAPLTCIDVRAGLVLTGSLDGIIEIFDTSGERIFYFEPGGSRYSIILGGAISSDGSRIGIISGIDQQRFLLFERFSNTGGDFRVVYHEFLDSGFRRSVYISFIDEDRRVIFERTGGLGYYNIRSRRGTFIPLDGVIHAIEDSGEKGVLFLITAHEPFLNDRNKNLIGIRFPRDRWLPFLRPANTETIFMRASFKSDDVFLSRAGTTLVVGGGSTLISFELEER